MTGTIERNIGNLHNQDTGLLVGYRNPITGKTEDLNAAAIQSLVSGGGNLAIDAGLINGRPADLKRIKLETQPRDLNRGATILYCSLGNSFVEQANGMFKWFSFTPGLLRIANAGVSGNSTAAMLARVATDVPDVCDACSIFEGSVDAQGAVTVAAHVENMTGIIDSLRARGIAPWIVAGPPISTLALAQRIEKYNLADWVLARKYGCSMFEPWARLADPSNGGFKSAFGGAVIHPNNLGYKTAGDELRRVYESRIPYLPLPRINTATAGLLTTNVCFLTDGDADGVADGLTKSGGGSASATYSLVAGTEDCIGNWQRIQTSAVTGAVNLNTATVATGYSTGDTLMGVARVKVDAATNALIDVYVRLNGVAQNKYLILNAAVPVAETVMCEEFVVPAGTTSVQMFVVIYAASGTHTADVSVAQMQVYNLTTALSS